MEILKPYRERIDALDDQIVDLLVERVSVVREVANVKAQENISVVLTDRVNEVCERNAKRAEIKGLDGNLVRDLYIRLIDHAHDLESSIVRKKAEEDIFGT